MELYGKILLIAIPIFFLLVLLEKGFDLYTGKGYVPTMDMMSSLSSGITNIVKDVLGLSITILSYEWMYEKLAIGHIESTIGSVIIAFILLDFQGYWVHRWSHEINIFWNKHAIHHSSEEFNLACALRQSISEFVRLFTFFLLPAALIGVSPTIIAIIAPIHLFAQFWYHTRHLNRLGWLENILVTPSHHRVHHAINPEYMDKNYSQIFIVWDKWFGTFQEERSDIPAVYGIKRQANTWNPIKINFQHLWLLIKDALRTGSWSDKIKIWFKPTGWRPADMLTSNPVNAVEDVYHLNKWASVENGWLKSWIWFQMLGVLGLLMYFFGHLAEIGTPGIYLYGLFIFIHIYAYTDLMDMNLGAVIASLLSFGLALYIIQNNNGWFGLDEILSFGSYLVLIWVILCTIGNIFLYFMLRNQTKNLKIA
ncbi:MAG: sterol desaturase family protein [Saprospiraceae bacterium]|nr:sterol desaturase family protein [Saprospiraceae bacterium]